MEPNKMKQKRRKYLYAAAALGMTFLLNLSGCSRRFTNYPETVGTVAIVDSTEREMMTYEDGYNAGQVEHEVKDGYIEVKIPPVGSIVLTGNDTAL